MTWIDEFRPGNKTIYVVFDKESDFSGPRTPTLSPDKVFTQKRTPKIFRKLANKSLYSLFIPFFGGPPRGDGPQAAVDTRIGGNGSYQLEPSRKSSPGPLQTGGSAATSHPGWPQKGLIGNSLGRGGGLALYPPL